MIYSSVCLSFSLTYGFYAYVAFKHVRYEVVDGGIAIITYDRADNKVNALNAEVGKEMEVLFNQLVCKYIHPLPSSCFAF